MFSLEELQGLALRIGNVDSERTARIVRRLADIAVACGMRPGDLPDAILKLACDYEDGHGSVVL